MTDRSRRGRVAMLWTDGGGRAGSARGIALLTSLLMIDSLHFVFARLLLPYIEPGPGAFYVMSFAALQVGIIGLALGRLRLEPLLRLWPVFLAIGLCVAVSTNLNYAAIAYIDPGVASMVSKMAVPFSLCFGMLWLGERFSPLQSVGTAIALVGLTVISFQPGDYLGQGTLMVLGSTLLYAVHTALTKRHMGEVDLLNFFFYRLLLTSGDPGVGRRRPRRTGPSKWSGAADNSARRHRRCRHQPLSLLLGAPTSRHEHSHDGSGGQPGGGGPLVALPIRRVPHRPAAARRRRNSGRCLPCRRRARLATSAAPCPRSFLTREKGSRVGVCNNLSAELGQGRQESNVFARKMERWLPGLPSVCNSGRR